MQNTEEASNLIKQIIQSDSTLSIMQLELVDILTARRGAAVARLKDTKQDYALKLALPDNDGPYDQHLLLQREGKILSSLKHELNNIYQHYGETHNTAWLLTDWCDAPSASEIATELRKNGDKQGFIKLFITLAKTVRQVHQLGYLHGDLQPTHFLIQDDKALLIDWGLAHKENERDFDFKGAFVHYAAPEVALGMLNKESMIPYTSASEVYALAAVMFFLYTGKTAVFYGSYDYKAMPFDEKLLKVSEGKLHQSFEATGSEPYPELEALLFSCLQHNAAQRPTFNPIVEALQVL